MLDRRGVTLGYAGPGEVRVRAPVTVVGRTFHPTATARVRLDGADLVVRAEDVDVGAGALVDNLVRSVARDRLSFRLPLTGLPFGVHVSDVAVRRGGVLVTATARNLVINVK
jgi:hypothetical protein